MTISDFGRYVLGICAAAGMLTGCGGSQVAPQDPMQQNAARSGLNTNAGSAKPDTSPLRGEVFTASNVTVKFVGRRGLTLRTNFSASGEATGPQPGTFVAKGSWSTWVLFHPGWSFSESFTIKSGARTISGTIAGHGACCSLPISNRTFGPATYHDGLRYKSRINGTLYYGPVTTNKIMAGSLGEMLGLTRGY
jgi:hypothetical protein